MKNKKALVVIMLLLVIILVACVGAYAYITLDVFKTPKQLFGKYLDNQIEQVKAIDVGPLKTVYEKIKTVPSEVEYNMDIEVDDEYELAKVSATYKEKVTIDPQNFKAMGNLKATINSVEGEFDEDMELPEFPFDTINYSFYADKEKLAAKIPELNEKYFSIKTKTVLDEMEKNLNIGDDKKIEINQENIEKYKNEFVEIYKRCIVDITSKFTDDKFTTEKNVNVDVNGQNITANKYSFNLKVSEFGSIAVDVLNKISEEKVLSDFMTEEQITEFKETIQYIDEKVKSLEEDQNIKFNIYGNNGKTVKLDFQLNDEVIAEFMVVNVSDVETNIIINAFKNKKEDGEVGSKTNITYSIKSENENTRVITISASNSYVKEDIKALKKYYEDEGYSYYSDEMLDEMYKDESLSQKVTITFDGDTITAKVDDIEKTEEYSETTYSIKNIVIKYKFGIQPKFEKLDDVIELEEYIENPEKSEELFEECAKNIQKYPYTALGGIVKRFSEPVEPDYPEDVSNSDEEDNTNDETTTFEEVGNRIDIENQITDSIDLCLESYKKDLEEDENTNIADYLTVEKISEMMYSSSISNIEFIDGSTLKCDYNGKIYYVELVLNGDTLKVDEATAYSESEYESR